MTVINNFLRIVNFGAPAIRRKPPLNLLHVPENSRQDSYFVPLQFGTTYYPHIKKFLNLTVYSNQSLNSCRDHYCDKKTE